MSSKSVTERLETIVYHQPKNNNTTSTTTTTTVLDEIAQRALLDQTQTNSLALSRVKEQKESAILSLQPRPILKQNSKLSAPTAKSSAAASERLPVPSKGKEKEKPRRAHKDNRKESMCLDTSTASHHFRSGPAIRPFTLHNLFATGCINIASVLHTLRCGADVNAQDLEGNAALHLLAKKEYSVNNCFAQDVAKLLIERGANPNLKNHEGSTPLHIAIQNCRSMETISFFLSYGADPNMQNNIGDTALHCLATKSPAKWPHLPLCANLLLEYKADPTVLNKLQQLPLHIAFANTNSAEIHHLFMLNTGALQPTPLHTAAQDISYDIYKFTTLLNANPTWLNQQDGYGNTAAHYAARFGFTEALQALIKCGANLRLFNTYGRTPLDQAVRSLLEVSFHTITTEKKFQEFNDLLHNLTNKNRSNATSPFARISRQEEAINVILDGLDSIDEEHKKRLISACHIWFKEHTPNEKLLWFTEGLTPLQKAAQNPGDYKAFCKVYGATDDIMERDKWGNTPLHYAASNGFLNAVELMLRHAPSNAANARNARGCTPLSFAVDHLLGTKFENIADDKTLDAFNRFIKLLETDDRFLLNPRQQKTHEEKQKLIINLLLDNDADVWNEHNDGETLLSYCIRWGREHTVEKLQPSLLRR